MPPSDLAQVVQGLPELVNENVLVCASTLDDAGVYKITDDKALVQTVDIFPPVVDDPYLYGQIVAANALSDVYAMGGTPITALNLAGFPTGQLPLDVLSQILRGGADKVGEAGACLLGGHTWNDQEVKYGIAVTGLVHPDRVVTNAGAEAGNTLILTEPLGSGLVTTALRKDAPGYTWDNERSAMAKKGAYTGEQSRRLDRILWRSAKWRPHTVRIIGTRPVAPHKPNLFPSDHFGLMGILQR